MSLLVLFSTVSFTVEKHFCGDNLIDVAIFSEAKKCDEKMEQTSKKSCCKDEFEVVKGQDELIFSSFEDLELNQKILITTFAFTYSNLFESLTKQIIPFKDYSPPNLVFDIQVLDQVFLI
jgi:hypothetical protein